MPTYAATLLTAVHGCTSLRCFAVQLSAAVEALCVAVFVRSVQRRKEKKLRCESQLRSINSNCVLLMLAAMWCVACLCV